MYIQYVSQFKPLALKVKVVIYSFILIALFNLYMSYTRNVFVGLFIFLVLYLYGRKKYFYLGGGLIGLVFVALYAGFFRKIFFDVYEPLAGKGDIGQMGSGRIGGWSDIMNHFLSAPIEEQIRGLGVTLYGTITKGAQIGGSHNDMLSTLICFGYIGFFLISCIYVALAYKILMAPVDRAIKCSFIGFLVAVGAMNFLSNSYLTRFELGQFFWLLIGIYYSLDRNQVAGCRT
jgi:O-antigen ligase